MSSKNITTNRPKPKRNYHPPPDANYELALAGAVLKQALEDALGAHSQDEAVHADALYWLEYGDGATVVDVLNADGLVEKCLNGTLKHIPDARTLAAMAETARTWEPEQLDLFAWWEVA